LEIVSLLKIEMAKYIMAPQCLNILVSQQSHSEAAIECIAGACGPAAQRKFRPFSLRNYHGHSDPTKVVDLMNHLLSIRAEQLVANSFTWKTIEAVAAALFKHLTAQEVKDIHLACLFPGGVPCLLI
jgi:hypothetical protein